jgi:hypothetical protein
VIKKLRSEDLDIYIHTYGNEHDALANAGAPEIDSEREYKNFGDRVRSNALMRLNQLLIFGKF